MCKVVHYFLLSSPVDKFLYICDQQDIEDDVIHYISRTPEHITCERCLEALKEVENKDAAQ